MSRSTATTSGEIDTAKIDALCDAVVVLVVVQLLPDAVESGQLVAVTSELGMDPSASPNVTPARGQRSKNGARCSTYPTRGANNQASPLTEVLEPLFGLADSETLP